MTTPVDIGTLIVSTPGTVGGRPRVDGTRIAVDHIAVLWNQGCDAEEIVRSKYPALTLGQVYAALAYYHMNKRSIDESIEREDVLYRKLSSQN